MNLTRSVVIGCSLALLHGGLSVPLLHADDGTGASNLAEGRTRIQAKLEASLKELATLQDSITAQKLPLSKELRKQEAELRKAREEYEKVREELDSHNLSVTNLDRKIKANRQEKNYLSNLLGEYTRNLHSQLHIVERGRYEKRINEAMLAQDNQNLDAAQVFAAQAGILDLTMERLEDLNGGTVFDGTAANADGELKQGTFMQVGPAAFFTAADGAIMGMAFEKLGSLQPNVVPFAKPPAPTIMEKLKEALSGQEREKLLAEDFDFAKITAETIAAKKGFLPIDTSLGNAHRIAETEETFMEEFEKGGVTMYAIFGLLAFAIVVSIWRGLVIIATPMPAESRVRSLLRKLGEGSHDEVRQGVAKMAGPAGRMLRAAMEHIHHPRELIEEVMYEEILKTRLKLTKYIPFIGVCAASAPLFGLLGTVMGIIETFKMLTVFGSGDVSVLAGGISVALITTKYGLIVAIPSLVLQAFLSRWAKSRTDSMEKMAVALLNQLDSSSAGGAIAPPAAPSSPLPAKPEEPVVGVEEVPAGA